MIAEAKRLCKNVIQTGLCRTAATRPSGCTALFMVCMVLRLRAERFLLDSGSPIWYNVPDKLRRSGILKAVKGQRYLIHHNDEPDYDDLPDDSVCIEVLDGSGDPPLSSRHWKYPKQLYSEAISFNRDS